MTPWGELLTKHRNLFLILLLAATLAVSVAANRDRLVAASATVNIPVTEAAAPAASALAQYRMERAQQLADDIAALEALCAQTLLDKQTREDAAEKLQTIIECRQAESALEGALSGSSLYPCVAVISGSSLTIVTEKSAITDRDSALVLTLAGAHAGISPENVRIITAE